MQFFRAGQLATADTYLIGRQLLCTVQKMVTSNATSVVPNVVAVDGLSPATNERSLFHLAEKVGPVQVEFLFAAVCCRGRHSLFSRPCSFYIVMKFIFSLFLCFYRS